jgi:hypothetical protein
MKKTLKKQLDISIANEKEK